MEIKEILAMEIKEKVEELNLGFAFPSQSIYIEKDQNTELNSLIPIIIIFGSLSLSITYILTSFSFIIRMIGAINNINAKSWNLASAVLLLNSFFIAISLSMIAFILDFQPKIHSLVIFFSLSIFLVFIGHIFMIWKFELTSNIIRTVSKFYFKHDLINKKIKIV